MDNKNNLNIENITDINLNNLNNLDYLKHENMTGDDLNKKLEEMLKTPEDSEAVRKTKEKAYEAYLKQLDRNRNYRKNNKEKIKAYMAELYRTNPEYKKSLYESRKNQYYIKKYGMSREDYLKIKEDKHKEIIAKFTNCDNTTKKTRYLSYEQFTNKCDSCKVIICN